MRALASGGYRALTYLFWFREIEKEEERKTEEEDVTE